MTEQDSILERKKLLEISTRLGSTLDEQEVTRLLAEGLTTLISYDTMAIYTADHVHQRLTPIIVEGRQWGKQDFDKWSIPFQQGIVGNVISSSRGEMVNNAHLDPRSLYPEEVPITTEQMIAIPLRLGDQCWGAFAMNRMSDAQFTETEFETAQFLASYASLALNNIKLIAEIKETQALRQVIFETISDSIITVNENGQIIFCNEVTEKIFGYSPYELIGEDLTKIMNEAYTGAHNKSFKHYLASGIKKMKSWSALELVGRHKDGHDVPIEVSFGETNSNGQRIFSAIIRDISQRKRSEQTIKSTKIRLENLIRTLQAGVLVEDEDRKIVLTNKTFCEFFGIPVDPDLLLGADCSQSAEQSKSLFVDPEGFVQGIDKLLTDRVIKVNEELILKDGRVLARDYVPIFVEDSYRGHMWLYRDITESKRTQQDLITAKYMAEESMRAKQDFLAKMSHELRTPINGVLGLANLVAASELSKENQEYLRGIRFSGEHLLSIINDILDLAKIEAGKMKLQQVIFRADELMEAMVSSQQPYAAEKKISLTLTLDPAMPESLLGDPVRFKQIMLNLTSNALKFTQSGEVNVSSKVLSKSKDEVLVEWKVKDTGIGIPSDKLQVIFESFTQADRNTAVKFGGTGLGLSIVKQLVELYHGKIDVISDPGKGSAFIVTLTFKYNEQVIARGPEKNWEDLTSFNGSRVLLVEDNLINQTVAKKTLEKWGIEVDVAGNGVEAIERLRVFDSYQLIIMDVQMPEMDGFEATRIIRKDFNEPVRSMPIMAMTASVLFDAVERTREAGMNDYISKPFNFKDLNQKLRKYLKESNQTAKETKEDKKTTNYIDLQFLETISPGNHSFQMEILNLFHEQSKQYLDEIKKAFEEGNFQRLKEKAHAFKPMGSYVGINSLTALVSELEHEAADPGKHDKIEGIILQVEVMVRNARNEISILNKK